MCYMRTDRDPTRLTVLPPTSISCTQAKRTEHDFFFFFFSRFVPATAYHRHALVLLLLCMLLSSVRRLSECFRPLYILTQVASLHITPSLLHNLGWLAVSCPPSRPSTWAIYNYTSLQVNASRCKSMQAVAASKGRDQACQMHGDCSLTSSSKVLFPASQDFGSCPRARSRGTRMGSRDESDLASLHQQHASASFRRFFYSCCTFLHDDITFTIDSSHSTRWHQQHPAKLPRCICLLHLVIISHLDLPSVRHRLQ